LPCFVSRKWNAKHEISQLFFCIDNSQKLLLLLAISHNHNTGKAPLLFYTSLNILLFPKFREDRRHPYNKAAATMVPMAISTSSLTTKAFTALPMTSCPKNRQTKAFTALPIPSCPKNLRKVRNFLLSVHFLTTSRNIQRCVTYCLIVLC